jgi:uncharacterized protein
MDQQEIIDQTAAFIKEQLSGESSGHDWWHVYRVWKSAVHIGKQEQTDMFVVEVAALLHDIADWKFHDGNDEVEPQRAAEWLQTLHVDDETIAHVCDIIRNISFKGAGVTTAMQTIEGKVVQDADRLDAIGAIGIARTFAYGGSKGREMYNPDLSPHLHDSFEAYKQNQSHTINHFYEKLLLLKERMNTATARQLAEQRHRVMEDYLDQFYREWDGEA